MFDSQSGGAKPSDVIPFSYNPEQLRRSFATRSPQQQPQRTAAAKADVLRVPGPPVELDLLGIHRLVLGIEAYEVETDDGAQLDEIR